MRRLLFVAFCIAIGLNGCATTPRPTPVRLTIVVAANANPDTTGRPSPVVVNIYDLAHAQRFNNANYLRLLDAPRKNLRDDLIGNHRTSAIAPGSRRELDLTLDANARYIGFVAELAQFGNARTSVALPLRAGRRTELMVLVDAEGITPVRDDKPAGFLPLFNND